MVISNSGDDEKNETEEKTKDEKSVGKLNPNKTAGLKLEMRLPGMQPPIKLPSLQGKFVWPIFIYGWKWPMKLIESYRYQSGTLFWGPFF